MQIVVLTRPGQPPNAFAAFTGEVLKTEGLHGYELRQWEPGQPLDLSDASVAILPPCILQYPEVDSLRAYVEGGGNLIAFQPMAHLLKAFGTNPQNRVLIDAYVKPVGFYRIGRSIGGESIQFHGSASKVSGRPRVRDGRLALRWPRRAKPLPGHCHGQDRPGHLHLLRL